MFAFIFQIELEAASYHFPRANLLYYADTDEVPETEVKTI